jgi:hypothetical protein
MFIHIVNIYVSFEKKFKNDKCECTKLKNKHQWCLFKQMEKQIKV